MKEKTTLKKNKVFVRDLPLNPIDSKVRIMMKRFLNKNNSKETVQYAIAKHMEN